MQLCMFQCKQKWVPRMTTLYISFSLDNIAAKKIRILKVPTKPCVCRYGRQSTEPSVVALFTLLLRCKLVYH